MFTGTNLAAHQSADKIISGLIGSRHDAGPVQELMPARDSGLQR
jgi:hypothetical protein